MIGLETAIASTLALVRSGHLSPMRWVDSLSLAPAKLVPDLDAGTLRAGERGRTSPSSTPTVAGPSREKRYARSRSTPPC
jgi:dihydroorotase-like cyclic amidohydrolase